MDQTGWARTKTLLAIREVLCLTAKGAEEIECGPLFRAIEDAMAIAASEIEGPIENS